MIEENVLENINNNQEIILTAQKKAMKKYYDKIKNDPEYLQKRAIISKRYYEKIKDNEEFKKKVSIQKKLYYAKKSETLLEVNVE